MSFSAAFKFDKADVDKFEDAFLQMVRTIAGSTAIKFTGSIAITEIAMDLGTPAISLTGAWCFIYNRDPTNYVTMLRGTASTAILRIPPKTGIMIFFDSGITAPYLIANTAAVIVSYWIIPA